MRYGQHPRGVVPQAAHRDRLAGHGLDGIADPERDWNGHSPVRPRIAARLGQGEGVTPVARSLIVWGVYALVIGALLGLFPNLLLQVLGIPGTSEPWIRLLGIVVVAIGCYYLGGARGEETDDFARSTVYGRAIVTVGIVAIAIGWSYWTLLPLAALEIGSAIWTWTLLQRHASTATA